MAASKAEMLLKISSRLTTLIQLIGLVLGAYYAIKTVDDAYSYLSNITLPSISWAG